MKFCPVVPEICHGHVHVAKKERRRIIIIIRNGAKTISLQTTFGRLKYEYEQTHFILWFICRSSYTNFVLNF